MDRKKVTPDRVFAWASRVFVWSIIFGILYLLRSFFLLIFLTFVFSYIQERAVKRLGGRIANRTLRVILVALVFLALIVGAGAYLLPSFAEEATVFVNNHPVYVKSLDMQVSGLLAKYPSAAALFGERYKAINPVGWTIDASPSALFLQQLFGLGEHETGGQNLKQSLELLKNVGGHLLSIVSAFLLSLLFSFLIVLDLPRLTRQVTSLSDTKLRFIYLEVAGSVYSFGNMLGRALEAQFTVAVLNTILTALGLFLLGFTNKLSFLSLMVFLCSFIPIAGVVISSIPICLVALQMSGITLMLLAILVITAVHLVETYILNPRIYGERLHMNAVLVLIVLTVAGKLFGIWGLVLGLPVSRYFFGDAIRR